MPELFRAMAPGSIMLLGEHAVLHGSASIVCAIDQFIVVELVPRSDATINILSDRFGEHVVSLNQIEFKKPFQFVLEAIRLLQHKMTSGFDLYIRSEFSDKLGLGSSAAVTVATITVLRKWLNELSSPIDIFHDALSVVHHVQMVGSGADVAASVFGGVVLYRADPFEVKCLDVELPLHLVYVGYKTPTVDVIRHVSALERENPKKYKVLYKCCDECAETGFKLLYIADLKLLGKLFSVHQELQEEMGVSDKTIRSVIKKVNKLPEVFGSKISGSGLGDCVVVLGDLPKDYFPRNKTEKEKGIRQIDVNVSFQGVIDGF